MNSLHVSTQSSPVSCDHTTVRTLLNLSDQWETVTELRAMQTIQSIQDAATSGFDAVSAIPLEEIWQGQETDPVFCIYGFSTRIHTDQGTNFESTLVAELLKLAGIEKSHTTAYHPMGNGGTERFNRTLGSMLRSLPLKEKHKWPEQIQTLTFAYNATVHETTSYAPFQLMFGRIPKLPVNVIFGQVLHDPVIVDHGSYAKTLMSYLHEAAHIAQKHTEKEQKKQAKSYNRRVKGTCLNIGDRVLLANKSERGKRKLADKWDPTVYIVKDRNLRTNIYKLVDEGGKSKVVHRNLILDISFLPIESPQDDEDTQPSPENVEAESPMSELSEEWSSDDGMEAWMLDGRDEGEGQEPVGGDDWNLIIQPKVEEVSVNKTPTKMRSLRIILMKCLI